LNQNETVFDLIGILEHPAFRWTGGTRTIAIICAAVAWTQEQTGLREPANGTTKMGAVHGENLELISADVPDPTCGIRGLPVARGYIRVPESGESRFTFRKLTGRAERHPGKIPVRASSRDRG